MEHSYLDGPRIFCCIYYPCPNINSIHKIILQIKFSMDQNKWYWNLTFKAKQDYVLPLYFSVFPIQ